MIERCESKVANLLSAYDMAQSTCVKLDLLAKIVQLQEQEICELKKRLEIT